MITEMHREKVKRHFLDGMRIAFPNGLKSVEGVEDADMAISMYANALVRFSPEQLERGLQQVVEKRRWQTWPSVADCVMACEATRRAGGMSDDDRETIKRLCDEKRFAEARAIKTEAGYG
tara:strand:- start:236 stop:595 length:360 start_codon:yes stop_codon:yes gene_type:complete